MINADELEWSEEEDESKYLMKSPAREEDFEVPDQENEALGGSNLIDHKRSKVFSGNVSLKWKENAQKPDKDVALDFGLPATFVHSNMAAIEKMGATSTYSLWQLCISRLSMSEKTGLVSVRQLRSEHLLAWLKTKFAFRPAQWNKVLEQFELDDFLSFFSLSNLLVTTFGDCVFEERKGPSRVSRPTCFCSYPACLQQRYEVEGACLPCVNLANEEEEENGEVDAQLRFKLEVLFGRMREELQGKLRVRHVLPILDELQVPYDRHRLPRAFWDYRGDFLLISAEQLLQLVRAIRVQETRHTDPLEHLFTYPLPVWLKEEFKASEILLYQHHFGMIDADKGGSIDAEELQQLFTSLGTTLSLTQAQTLIDEYDIDGGGTVDFVEFLVLIYKVQRGAIDLQDNGIARVLNEAKAQLKVFEEIEEVNLHPPEGSVIRSFGGSPVNCEFDVEVGAETVHYVRIKVTFREGHPYFCPAIEVLTRIASPNVLMQLDGRGRVLHIEEVWSAAWSLRQLAEHLRALLACPDLSLLPDRYAGIVQDWQRGIQRLQAAEKREPEAAADPSDSKDRGEEGAAEPSGAQRDVGAQAEQGDVLKEPQDQKEQQVENSEFPGEDAERPEAKPLSLEAISSAGTLSRIQAMSRVEQLHVSQLFLFVTDRAAHQAFALQVLERYGERKRVKDVGDICEDT